jgi:hypothetical protein
MNFDKADQLSTLALRSSNGHTRQRWEYKGAVHRLYTDFKKVHDSVPRDILYNMFNECDILINLVRLNRICLKVTYNKVQSWRYLSVTVTVQNGLNKDMFYSYCFATLV